MSDEQWIIIPNWNRYQNYTDRTPPYIKLWLELQDKDEWYALNYTERGLLVSIWLLYARCNGIVSTQHLHRACTASTRREHLTSLNHAGFIDFSAVKPSRVRAIAPAGARTLEEKKRRREEEERGRASEPHQHGARTPAEEKDPPRANADAYKPYVHEEPDVDPDALARLLELQARIGRDLPR
jgi:hypothetical protein